MPRYIVKMTKEGIEAYMEWSTIVDAPVTYLMSLEEFKQYYRDEYGRDGMIKLHRRMERVETNGISAHDGVREYDSLWKYNRAGDDEAQLTKDEVWQKYYVERPQGESPDDVD